MAKSGNRAKKAGTAQQLVQKPVIARNIVQCYSLQFNKAATFLDRKKAEKRGHTKHRQKFDTDGGFCLPSTPDTHSHILQMFFSGQHRTRGC